MKKQEKWQKVQICLVIRKNTGVKSQESVLSLKNEPK